MLRQCQTMKLQYSYIPTNNGSNLTFNKINHELYEKNVSAFCTNLALTQFQKINPSATGIVWNLSLNSEICTAISILHTWEIVTDYQCGRGGGLACAGPSSLWPPPRPAAARRCSAPPPRTPGSTPWHNAQRKPYDTRYRPGHRWEWGWLRGSHSASSGPPGQTSRWSPSHLNLLPESVSAESVLIFVQSVQGEGIVATMWRENFPYHPTHCLRQRLVTE